MKLVHFILASGKTAAFFFGNNNVVVFTDDSNHIRIQDGIHNNGGWKLHQNYTLDQVVEMIQQK